MARSTMKKKMGEWQKAIAVKWHRHGRGTLFMNRRQPIAQFTPRAGTWEDLDAAFIKHMRKYKNGRR